MVYLIHFDQPFKHARHYIGYAENDLEQRIEKHKSGFGAKLMRAVTNAGIEWKVVRVWNEGDRTFERKLKNWKKSSCLCPECTGSKKKVA
jgi:predicted GIY-YIG superfamily endonuclease